MPLRTIFLIDEAADYFLAILIGLKCQNVFVFFSLQRDVFICFSFLSLKILSLILYITQKIKKS